MMPARTAWRPDVGQVAERSTAALTAYMREWAASTRERIRQGEPFILTDVFVPHEIFVAMDIPFAVSGMHEWYYRELIENPDPPVNPEPALPGDYAIRGVCGACGVRAPLGRLPRITAIIASELNCGGNEKANQMQLRDTGIPVFRLERNVSRPYSPRYPRWWEKDVDHWDELIEPHRLDYRVEEIKALIRFLEVHTGRTFNQSRLMQVMELVNEQECYWTRARDLIARTKPCPVGFYDQLINYIAQWHRGTPQARDLAKVFYEEVKERVDTGQAVCAGEKYRLQWVKTAYYRNPKLYQAWEESHGAVFVCSWYLSIAADGYARNCLGDPMRALAGRHLMLGLYTGPDWDIYQAKQHGVNGALMMASDCPGNGVARKLTQMAYEQAEVPMFLIEPTWDEETIRSRVSSFIETRLA